MNFDQKPYLILADFLQKPDFKHIAIKGRTPLIIGPIEIHVKIQLFKARFEPFLQRYRTAGIYQWIANR